MNAFGKMTEIFLFAVLVFLMPLQYEAQKEESIIQNYITTETAYLIDSAANLGYLDRNMVELYEKKLSQTGYSYDVVFTAHKWRVALSEGGEAQAGASEDGEAPGFGEAPESGELQETAELPVQTEGYEYIGDSMVRKALYEGDNRFQMKQGDFLSVQVSSRGKTHYGQLRAFFLMRDWKYSGIFVQYGGMIKDEAY